MIAVIVVPSIDADRTAGLIESMASEVRALTLIVDNGGRFADPDDASGPFVSHRPENIGVAPSWNLGLDLAEARGSEWCVVMSDAIRFGEAGGRDLLEALVEAIDRPEFPIVHANDFAWHLQAIRRSTWERVGRFDPIFAPAYFEDTDYLYRMGLAGLPSPRENGGQFMHVELDATDLGNAHSIMQGLVTVDYGAQAAKYRAKWGGDQGAERFVCPYDCDWLDYRYVGPPPDSVKGP